MVLFNVKKGMVVVNKLISKNDSSLLFLSFIGAMGLNFVSSIFVSNALGPEKYGDLKFIQIIWYITSILVSFGLLQSASRLILIEEDTSKQREAIGIGLLIVFVISLLFSFLLIIFSKPIDGLFRTNLSNIIVILSPLIVFLVLRDYISLVLQSLSKIRHLVCFNFFSPLLYLGCVLLLAYFEKLTIFSALLVQLSSLGFVCITIVVVLKPKLINFSSWICQIKMQNKGYGFSVYLSQIAGVATGQLNRLAISYWVDTTAIGFFSLALTLVEPLRFIPVSISTASYREFYREKKIPSRIIVSTIITSLLGLIGIWIFLGEPLSVIYSSDFESVGRIAQYAAVGAVIHGFGDFFARFLSSKGLGKPIKETAYFIGIFNIIGFVIFVPLLGMWGALIVSLLVDSSYFLKMLYEYNKHGNIS